MTTAYSHHYHHCSRSSFRSVSADEDDDFHISGCTSGPHSKSKIVFLQCNYLHSEIEHLEERDFLTFRNETVKRRTPKDAKERKRQVTTNQQVTTFQLPEATQATLGCKYILTIPYSPYQILKQCLFQLCSLHR